MALPGGLLLLNNMTKEEKTINELENDVVILTTKTVEYLLSVNPDALALYLFFIKNSKIQKTPSIYNTEKFGMTGLGWGREKYRKAKQCLTEEGFIEEVIRRDEKKRITGHYVYIKYLWGQQTIEKTIRQVSHPVDKATSSDSHTNALSNKSLNALTNTNEIPTPTVLEECLEQPTSTVLTLDPELRGSTPAQRLLTIYNDCYKYVYGVPYKPNYQKDLSVLKRLTQRFSECQLARMLVIHFNWYGMSGNNERDNIFLKEALFSIGLFSSNVNKYEVYIRNVLGENFDDDYTMLTETGKYILSIKK